MNGKIVQSEEKIIIKFSNDLLVLQTLIEPVLKTAEISLYLLKEECSVFTMLIFEDQTCLYFIQVLTLFPD